MSEDELTPMEVLWNMGVEPVRVPTSTLFGRHAVMPTWVCYDPTHENSTLVMHRGPYTKPFLKIDCKWIVHGFHPSQTGEIESLAPWWQLIRRCRVMCLVGMEARFVSLSHVLFEQTDRFSSAPTPERYLVSTTLCSARSLPQLPACLIKRLPPELVREIVRALFG